MFTIREIEARDDVGLAALEKFRAGESGRRARLEDISSFRRVREGEADRLSLGVVTWVSERVLNIERLARIMDVHHLGAVGQQVSTHGRNGKREVTKLANRPKNTRF